MSEIPGDAALNDAREVAYDEYVKRTESAWSRSPDSRVGPNPE